VPHERPRTAPEPQSGICPAEQIDLVGPELETMETEVRQSLHTIAHESDPQVLVSEQLVDNDSNHLSRHCATSHSIEVAQHSRHSGGTLKREKRLQL
jgi:hypothetical protein